ncbi:MAG: hypothetical protein OSB19_16940 [Opitutaceae bacterium]|nr:hypothetical protein [Opitutaceae bacterium]
MTSVRSQVTFWRATVDGKQIGSSNATRSQALAVAYSFIEKEGSGHLHPTVRLMPSFTPTEKTQPLKEA